MAKKPTKADRQFVKDSIDKWRKRMFLCEWFIDVHYATEDEPDCSAENHVKSDYLRSEITIYPNFWEAPRDWQEHCLVHELAHILTEPMYRLHIVSQSRSVMSRFSNPTLADKLYLQSSVLTAPLMILNYVVLQL